MRVPDPSTVTSELELRRYAVRLLAKWIADLDRTGFAFIFPGARGSCGSFPTCPFHLRPRTFSPDLRANHFSIPHEVCQVGPGEICLVSRGLPHRGKGPPLEGAFLQCRHRLRPGRHSASPGSPGQQWTPLRGDRHRVADGRRRPPGRSAEERRRLVQQRGQRAAAGGQGLAPGEPLHHSGRDQRGSDGNPRAVKVMQMRRLIHPHLSHPQLSVDWIGRSLQNNAEYLSHLFREARGRTLVSYIIERRMIRAKELLASSTLNISESAVPAVMPIPATSAGSSARNRFRPAPNNRQHALRQIAARLV